MSELVEWYRAQLDEDERVAVAVLAGDPSNGQWFFDVTGAIRDQGHYAVAQCEPENHEAQRHIARHDPARVLRDVAAKRAILGAYEHKAESMARYPGQGNAGGLFSLTVAVQHLASAHSDRPGYRSEWAP